MSSEASDGVRRKPVRLCVVMGGHWSVEIGGAQYQVNCILDEIADRKEFETYFLAHATPDETDQGSYQIVRIGFRTITRLRLLPNLPSLYRALKKLRPDVIYQRELMPYTGVCALYCARHGARFVFHIAHDNDARRVKYTGWAPVTIRNRLERWISEYGLRHAGAVIAQTQDQARLLRAEFGIEAAAVVPNFHPLPAASAIVRDPQRLRVIWVANFKAWKHPEMFVDLAQAFAGRGDIEFVMIGRPGPEKLYAALHARIAQLPNLRYAGELPIERVNDEIAASHVFVNTSSSEGFANTFIQAWLRGVPVVSCGVDPDGCLSKGGAGIVAGSLEGLKSVIADLANDRARLSRLSATALAFGRANHVPARARPLLDLLSDRGRD